ncbi:hypothetical protein CZ809_03822 [Photobacterium piscicola]|uniref:Mobilization protein n=1 Tax=Photobacterium piscicola TaxID=1378299 RepID=A0A1T5I521_9GAMM|nr:hypothetical protein [Photobacterium piscicola]SKC34210.1 hypothetical protein CZ809_03822 [Photobacterium piscicola]
MKRTYIKARISKNEKIAIAKKADNAGISVSEYIRKSALNAKIHSKYDDDLFDELLRMNTDLKRLGNLFRLSLKESVSYTPSQLKLIEDNLFFISSEIKRRLLNDN